MMTRKTELQTTLYKLTAVIALLILMLMGLASLPYEAPKSNVTSVKAGEHYQQVSQSPLTKTDITIFFWYGCPHCLKVYQAMDMHGFSEEVRQHGLTVRKVPVALNPNWVDHAKLFHAFEISGLSDDGHLDAMRKIQRSSATSGIRLDSVIKSVIDAEKANNPNFNASFHTIRELMDSDRVKRLMANDARLASQVKLQGVPTFLVKGMYTSTLGSGIGYSDLPAIALKLAAKGDKQ